MTSSADINASAPRLERPREGRMVAGVCAGIARHLRIDPTLVRIAFVVGLALGGAGIAAYAAGFLLMPSEGRDKSPLMSINRGRAVTVIGVILLVIGASAGLHAIDDGAGNVVGPIALAGLGIYLLMRARGRDSAPVTSSVVADEPQQRSSRKANLTVTGLMLLGIGIVAALAAAGVDLGWEAARGVIVMVAGAALVGGAFFGASPWLALPALLVAGVVGAFGAADVQLRGPVGERTFHPATAAELPGTYRMAMGDMKVDLRDVALPPGTTHLKVRLGIGGMRVYVPRGVALRVEGHAGAGRLELAGVTGDGSDVDRSTAIAAAGRPELDIDAKVGFGEVRVFRGGGSR